MKLNIVLLRVLKVFNVASKLLEMFLYQMYVSDNQNYSTASILIRLSSSTTLINCYTLFNSNPKLSLDSNLYADLLRSFNVRVKYQPSIFFT